MRKRILAYICSLIIFLLLIFGQSVNVQVATEITPEQFSRMCTEMSEYGGRFSSENWVSNEISYLQVLEPLEELSIKGGVYIGVASNQNFTYISAIKPELAFIVDIRHQNRMQHLVYKIIFELAETPAEFISLLLSRQLDPETGPKAGASINDITNYFYKTPQDQEMAMDTEKKIVDILTNKYKFDLADRDLYAINRVLYYFRIYGLNITYTGQRRSWYPTYGELLTLQENGKQLNAFNSMEDYSYLRKMHLENKIIPVTGDFGGVKALLEISKYLKACNLTVSAFYVSNVEQYLFRGNSWRGWVSNVKNLPVTDTSVFIRWIHEQRYRGYGNYSQTRLQWIKTFIKNYDEGRYYSYNDVKYLDYIK